MLRHQHDVGLAIGRAQGDIARMPAHHFDDGDAAMAFGRGADALDAAGRDEHRRGIAGRDIIDHLLHVELGSRRPPLVAKTGMMSFDRHPQPLVDLVRIIQSQVVVDRLGGQHRRQPVAQRLQPVERAVAADADQPLDLQALQAVRDVVHALRVIGVDVIARSTENRPSHRRIQFGNRTEQRIQVKMGDPRVEQAVESLDQAIHLDLQLIRPHDGAVNRGVQRRRIAASRENSNAFHK